MTKYAINVFGWLMVVEAASANQALAIARQNADAASLLPTDINISHVRVASDEDGDWFDAMCGVNE